MPMLSQNRFWMELHAFNIKGFVANPHDFVDIASLILGPGGQFQAIWQTGLLYHQRMVTSGGEGII